jgi:hypothetical protein
MVFQNFGCVNSKFIRFFNSVRAESAEYWQKPSNLLTLMLTAKVGTAKPTVFVLCTPPSFPSVIHDIAVDS